jgi:peptide/nickel transport system permease protein
MPQTIWGIPLYRPMHTQTEAAVIDLQVVRKRSRDNIFARLLRNRLALVGMIITAIVILTAIFAPWLAPYDPLDIELSRRLQPPSWEHLMGTDHFGRDILSRLIYGANISLQVGVVSVAFGTVIGLVIGAAAGYLGRSIDTVLMSVMDAIYAFPAILLALALVAVFGPGMVTVMTAIAIVRIPIFARTVRSSVMAEKEKEYIEAARSIGQYEILILIKHILPNIISPMIVVTTTYFAAAIVVEASLSFLGLGVPPPAASWGVMLNDGRRFMEQYPHTVIFPGLAISLSVLGFNLLGDGLRDVLDPRLRNIS